MSDIVEILALYFDVTGPLIQGGASAGWTLTLRTPFPWTVLGKDGEPHFECPVVLISGRWESNFNGNFGWRRGGKAGKTAFFMPFAYYSQLDHKNDLSPHGYVDIEHLVSGVVLRGERKIIRMSGLAFNDIFGGRLRVSYRSGMTDRRSMVWSEYE